MKEFKNEDIKLPSIPPPIIIDSPNDKFAPYRDHLSSFQKSNRGYVSKREKLILPTVRKGQRRKDELSLTAPFRLQSKIYRENDCRPTPKINSETHIESHEMEKTGALNNIRYWSEKYKRFSESSNRCDAKQVMSNRPKVVKTGDSASRSYITSPKCVYLSSAESSSGRISTSLNLSTCSFVQSTSDDVQPISPPVRYKSYGPSSRFRVGQTLAQFLVKYGFEKSTLCMTSSEGLASVSAGERSTFSNKNLFSRIDSYIIDSNSYDDFARNSEKTVIEKSPRYVPKPSDHSVSKSELGICFPVFISEDVPIRKCGRVLR